jgi:hypothetical protein
MIGLLAPGIVSRHCHLTAVVAVAAATLTEPAVSLLQTHALYTNHGATETVSVMTPILPSW